MQTEHFIARNVKCNGCVNTIRKNLLTLPGVETVEVIIATLPGSAIKVSGTQFLRENINTRLSELGYPVGDG